MFIIPINSIVYMFVSVIYPYICVLTVHEVYFENVSIIIMINSISVGEILFIIRDKIKKVVKVIE